ncbi:hypothetical protein N7517_006199 [Penicillium concentricum]|uniref:Uncharacterized protein n=1 Tax=Penicillium concentricum TaxID=293559 RepID=A0A9W9S901_9EURO|nr:uncharacterized protein N7517_006199 [Penicillium concentricum]KAJ5374193.1 hypothetical protein N7517_006199 [Penicillium concentricum]
MLRFFATHGELPSPSSQLWVPPRARRDPLQMRNSEESSNPNPRRRSFSRVGAGPAREGLV